MRFHNTLTRQISEFVPIVPGKVNLFVCGPTVYDAPHLGHAKTYTQFDLIARLLRSKGLQVFYLQNITDIDDKIIRRSAELGITPKELARKFEDVYKEDMHALHNDSVSEYARATDYIPQIVKQVQALVAKGQAYRIDDGYYFELSTFKEYGKLSKRTTLAENDSVSRVDENDQKRGNGDFCLWKAAKPGEPVWETELGPGRPGWHIEDTAITESFFGAQYDVHGGGLDLIFPHHEAEIAQMESASGKEPLVRYWLHTAFLNINSEKMSKSTGNFKTIKDLLAQYDYRTLRYFFLSQHYRTAMDFSTQSIDAAKNALRRINDCVQRIDPQLDDAALAETIARATADFDAAMEDDVDTPKALAVVFDLIRELNSEGSTGERAYAFFKRFDALFDVVTFDKGSIDEEIEALIAQREAARKGKDFATSDRIRDELKARGIILEDGPQGITWKRA
jgi:cysteinyl-tRNA synthetase